MRGWIRNLIQSWFSRPREPLRKARPVLRLWVEALEDRVVPSTWVVTNTNNSASVSGSLPWAVAQANTDTSIADITFNPTDFASATTITLAANLILSNTSYSTTIDGTGAGPITINGDNDSYGLELASFVTATVNNLTIAQADSVSGAISAGGFSRLTMNNDTVTYCSNGTMYLGGTSVVMNRCFITNSNGLGRHSAEQRFPSGEPRLAGHVKLFRDISSGRAWSWHGRACSAMRARSDFGGR